MDLAARKSLLRIEMAQRRRAVAPEVAAAAAESVASHVAALPEFAAAQAVALYAALPDELPSRPLFERIRAAGKIALFPRSAAGGLEFASAPRWEDLREGRYGVLAPTGETHPIECVDLVLVPGIAFDRHGRRLGRGGGYYDRVFVTWRGAGAVRVGVAYEFQRVDEVPHEPHDVAVDVVVTERGAHRCEERA